MIKTWPVNSIVTEDDGRVVIHELKRIMKKDTVAWTKSTTSETNHLLTGWDDSETADSCIQCDDCNHQATYNGSSTNHRDFYKCCHCGQEYIIQIKGRRNVRLVSFSLND